MEIGKRIGTDKECVEKGRLWSDYILQLSHALHMGHIPVNRLLVSFDVLIALMQYSMDRSDRNEFCMFRSDAGRPADVESIADCDRYFYYTANDRIEVMVDMFAHPDTVEFA